MIIPMFFLAILSIIVGFIFSDFFIGWGTYSWGSSIYILPKNFGVIDLEFLHPIKKNLGFFFSLLGLFIVFFLLNFYDKIFYRSLKILKLKLNFIYNFFGQFFYNAILLNFIYNNLFLFIFKFSYKFTKILDKGFFELIGPFGFYKLFKFLSISSRKFSSNIISYNIFFVLLFFVLIFFFMFFVSFALPLWIIGLIFFFREI
jgi:NADH-ubiquinone oxidoreductase chain 5